MEEFLLCNFIEITFLHGWSPVNLLRFCRTPFVKDRGLPLEIYTKRETHSFLFLVPLQNHNSSIPLVFPLPVPCIPTLVSCIPLISTLIPNISILIPHILNLMPCIPTLIPIIPTLIPCIPINLTLIPRIPIILTLILRISIVSFIPFPDSLFRLLQIALLVIKSCKFSFSSYMFLHG